MPGGQTPRQARLGPLPLMILYVLRDRGVAVLTGKGQEDLNSREYSKRCSIKFDKVKTFNPAAQVGFVSSIHRKMGSTPARIPGAFPFERFSPNSKKPLSTVRAGV